jgi:hypothetical protein
MDYRVKYVEGTGWMLFKGEQAISVIAHNSEWDALDELKFINPDAYEELYLIHRNCE